MDKKSLKKYAELLVEKGVNLQKGQTLVVAAPVGAADFVGEIARAAYRRKAANVEILWSDPAVARMGYRYRTKSSLSVVPEWVVAQRRHYIDEKVAYLSVLSEDPEILKGIDPEKVAAARRARSKALAEFREYTSSNKIRWCIAAYPEKAWAKKMFPGLPQREAMKRQWEAIARTVRLDEEDPIAAWEEHQKNLERRCALLNGAKIRSFTYRNGIGTDFTIGMPKGYLFCGGAEKGALDGVPFTANMPTEEVFSCPDRATANGRLVASKPLCRNGQIIDGFWFEFRDGKVVDYGAEQGLSNLKSILDTDEGSRRLGEIALVGYHSPVQSLGLMFYETLFDENASCHFALGDCYPCCLEGGGDMTEEQLKERGLNHSLEHVDFMVGTEDLSVTAETESGERLTVFENGDWVI